VRHPWGTARLKVMQGWKRYINLHHCPPAIPSTSSRRRLILLLGHLYRSASRCSPHRPTSIPYCFVVLGPPVALGFLALGSGRRSSGDTARSPCRSQSTPPSIHIYLCSLSSSPHTAAEESLDGNECSTPSIGESPISLTQKALDLP
jgi:hypothetical protein